MIYPKILHDELIAAGYHVIGVSSSARVWDENGDIQSRADISAIVLAHKGRVYDVDDFGNLRQAEITFDLPIVAPTGTFGDVYVASQKTEETAELALQAAEIEMKKSGRKSIAKIILNLAEKYLPDLETKVKKAKM